MIVPLADRRQGKKHKPVLREKDCLPPVKPKSALSPPGFSALLWSPAVEAAVERMLGWKAAFEEIET